MFQTRRLNTWGYGLHARHSLPSPIYLDLAVHSEAASCHRVRPQRLKTAFLRVRPQRRRALLCSTFPVLHFRLIHSQFIIILIRPSLTFTKRSSPFPLSFLFLTSFASFRRASLPCFTCFSAPPPTRASSTRMLSSFCRRSIGPPRRSLTRLLPAIRFEPSDHQGF